MKAITRRLSRLENRYVPRKSDEPSPAEQIRERRRLRYEREGRPFTRTSPEVLSSIPFGLSIAARMRWHRDYRRSATEALVGQQEAGAANGR